MVRKMLGHSRKQCLLDGRNNKSALFLMKFSNTNKACSKLF